MTMKTLLALFAVVLFASPALAQSKDEVLVLLDWTKLIRNDLKAAAKAGWDGNTERMSYYSFREKWYEIHVGTLAEEDEQQFQLWLPFCQGQLDGAYAKLTTACEYGEGMDYFLAEAQIAIDGGDYKTAKDMLDFAATWQAFGMDYVAQAEVATKAADAPLLALGKIEEKYP
jgi:hypothetical protein